MRMKKGDSHYFNDYFDEKSNRERSWTEYILRCDKILKKSNHE